MPFLTGLGEQYFLTLAQGGLAAQYSTGYDRMACIDDDDTLIDDVETITWGWSAGKADIFVNQDPIFTIPAGTTVKSIAFFNSGVRNAGTAGTPDIAFSTSGDLEFADALAIYPLETMKVFTIGGTIQVPNARYNFFTRQ